MQHVNISFIFINAIQQENYVTNRGTNHDHRSKRPLLVWWLRVQLERWETLRWGSNFKHLICSGANHEFIATMLFDKIKKAKDLVYFPLRQCNS